MPTNYYNFFTEVEEYFIRKRGRNLLVSPLDWCLIELWKENGIPLHIVLRGIDRSFESNAARRKGTPSSLHYCHPAIMEAFAEYQEAKVGGREGAASEAEQADGDLSRGQVVQHLRGLAAAVSSRGESACQQAAERMAALLQEVEESGAVDWGRLDRELSAIASGLANELEGEISPDAATAMAQAEKEELKPYRKRLSKEMYHRLQSRHHERMVLSHFGLPEFSLLGLE